MSEDLVEITLTGIRLTGKPAVITATAGAVLGAGYCLVNHRTTLPRLVEFFKKYSAFVRKFGRGSLVVNVVTETAEGKKLMLEQAASGELLTALNNMEGVTEQERFEKLEIVELHTEMVTSKKLEQIKLEAHRNVQSAVKHGLKEERPFEYSETETKETSVKRTTHTKKRSIRTNLHLKHQPPSEATAETSESKTSQQTCPDQPSKKIKLSHPRESPVEKNPQQQQKYYLEDVFFDIDTSNPEEAYARMNRMYGLPAKMSEANFHLDYYSILMRTRRYNEAKEVRARLAEFIAEQIEVTGEGLEEFAGQLINEERYIEAIFFYILAAEAYMRQEKDRERDEGLVTSVEGLTTAAINFNDEETRQKTYLGDNVFPLIEKYQEEISKSCADKVHQARMDSCVGQFELQIFKHRERALELLGKAAPILQASDLFQSSGGCYRIIGTIHENDSKFVDAKEFFKKAKDCFKKEKKQLDPADDSENIENVLQDIKDCEKSIKKCNLRLIY